VKPNSPAEVRSEVVPFMTEERSALQEMARDFAMREVLPIANELDPVAGEIPMELRRKMADLGFFGILVPEEYGGLGLGLSEYAVIVDGVRGTPIRKIGYHGWKTWELSFENAYAETMIGAEGEGFKVAMGDLDTARVHTAARAIGLARGPLEDATAYAKQRVQFGRPIAQNQAIRFRIADMATQVAAARSLMFQVCTEVDAGRTSPASASMVKLFASEMAEKVTSDALQIHGGSGYTTDFPVERYWRDARLTKPEAGLRPWSTFVVNAAAGGLDLQQSATGLGGQAEATVAVGSGAVHTSSLAAQANRFDPPSSACQVRRSGRLPPRGGRRAVVHGPVDPRHGRRRRVRGAAGHRRAARQRWRRLLQQSGRRRGRPWQRRPGQHRSQLRLGRARGHADQPGRRGSHRQLRRPRRRPPATVRGQPPTVSGQGPRSAHTTSSGPRRGLGPTGPSRPGWVPLSGVAG